MSLRTAATDAAPNPSADQAPTTQQPNTATRSGPLATAIMDAVVERTGTPAQPASPASGQGEAIPALPTTPASASQEPNQPAHGSRRAG